jgi:hypothetical protein
MPVKGKEESTKVFDNVFAWCPNESADHCLVKIPISHTTKLSLATCDHANVIHIRVLIKDVLHFVYEGHPHGVAAFGHQVEENPKKRFKIIRDFVWPARRIA